MNTFMALSLREGITKQSTDNGNQKERIVCVIELNGLRAKINIGQTTDGSRIGR